MDNPLSRFHIMEISDVDQLPWNALNRHLACEQSGQITPSTLINSHIDVINVFSPTQWTPGLFEIISVHILFFLFYVLFSTIYESTVPTVAVWQNLMPNVSNLTQPAVRLRGLTLRRSCKSCPVSKVTLTLCVALYIRCSSIWARDFCFVLFCCFSLCIVVRVPVCIQRR